MKSFKNVEIFSISVVDGKLTAVISFQSINPDTDNLTDGYDTLVVPINIRAVQLSSEGNPLVNQSEKENLCSICEKKLNEPASYYPCGNCGEITKPKEETPVSL